MNPESLVSDKDAPDVVRKGNWLRRTFHATVIRHGRWIKEHRLLLLSIAIVLEIIGVFYFFNWREFPSPSVVVAAPSLWGFVIAVFFSVMLGRITWMLSSSIHIKLPYPNNKRYHALNGDLDISKLDDTDLDSFFSDISSFVDDSVKERLADDIGRDPPKRGELQMLRFVLEHNFYIHKFKTLNITEYRKSRGRWGLSRQYFDIFLNTCSSPHTAASLLVAIAETQLNGNVQQQIGRSADELALIVRRSDDHVKNVLRTLAGILNKQSTDETITVKSRDESSDERVEEENLSTDLADDRLIECIDGKYQFFHNSVAEFFMEEYVWYGIGSYRPEAAELSNTRFHCHGGFERTSDAIGNLIIDASQRKYPQGLHIAWFLLGFITLLMIFNDVNSRFVEWFAGVTSQHQTVSTFGPLTTSYLVAFFPSLLCLIYVWRIDVYLLNKTRQNTLRSAAIILTGLAIISGYVRPHAWLLFAGISGLFVATIIRVSTRWWIKPYRNLISQMSGFTMIFMIMSIIVGLIEYMIFYIPTSLLYSNSPDSLLYLECLVAAVFCWFMARAILNHTSRNRAAIYLSELHVLRGLRERWNN